MYHFYLSFKYAGETPENKHQYITEYTDESGEMLFFEEKIDPELEYFYFMKTCYSQPSACIEFLEYHYSQYLLKNPGKQINFIYFVEERLNKTFGFTYKNPEGDKFVTDEETIPLLRQNLIREWIEKKKNEIQVSEIPVKQGEKITWNGTPSQFGYLFLELVKNGFIEPPLYNGETNYTGFARLCFQYFDIDTTPGNLENQLNPNKNQLSDTKRAKFTIPDLSDLR